MDFESWFLVLAVAACCMSRGVWYWFRFSSGVLERARHIVESDDHKFSQSLGALDSKVARDQKRNTPTEALELSTREEQIVAS